VHLLRAVGINDRVDGDESTEVWVVFACTKVRQPRVVSGAADEAFVHGGRPRTRSGAAGTSEGKGSATKACQAGEE
jgi:hypothetical protein